MAGDKERKVWEALRLIALSVVPEMTRNPVSSKALISSFNYQGKQVIAVYF